MLFDGVKSAEPPKNSGSSGAKPLSASPEATRVDGEAAFLFTSAINF